jgi:hypothetical protein
MTNLKRIIPENWAAIEEVEKKVREQTGDPKAGFNAGTLFFGVKFRSMAIPCLYRGKKGKKGQEVFTQKYNEMMIFIEYCPFTGKPLYTEEEN